MDVAEYLRKRGVAFKPADARNVHTSCFYCDEDPSKRGRLYINIDPDAEIAGLFMCHKCGAKGSLVSLKKFFGDKVGEDEIDHQTRVEILDLAARYYVRQLGQFSEVVSYLKGPERGLHVETLKAHQIGYAPMEITHDLSDGTTTTVWPRRLYGHLRDQGYASKDILATGLCQERDGKLIDSFGGMITIPYVTAGNVVAIRGRTWPYSDGDFSCWLGESYTPAKAKYKTCSGTGTRLFNADSTWNSDEIFVTEGEFDALILEQNGFPAVGVPGAAAWQESWDDYLTPLKRVWLVYDRDAAGEKGAAKLVERVGDKVRRVHLSEEGEKCDPTMFFAEHTLAEFQQILDAVRKGGLLVTVHEARDEFAAIQNEPGIKFGWEELDTMIAPGLQAGQIMVLLAKTGCLAGDTDIVVNRGGAAKHQKLSTMYERWQEDGRYAWDRSIPTRIQRADGDQIRLGEVDEIWYSGVKDTFELTTVTGRTIKATAEHPFLTPNGWKKLGELEVGDLVHVNGGRSTKGRGAKYSYLKRSGLIHHPYRSLRNAGTNHHCVWLHRLVAEAELNHLELDEFLERCRKGPVEDLQFLDPEIWAVHHIDRNHRNNEPSNLKVLTHAEHHALHAADGAGAHVLEQVGTDAVASIEYLGKQDTYDISMKDEPHNFVANGFVVHNTGKSLLLFNMLHLMRMLPEQADTKILLLSLEQTRGEWWDRARRIHRFYNINSDEAEAARWWEDNILLVDQNRVTEAQLRQALDDFEYQMGSMPDLLAVDYLGYWSRSFRGEPYERTSAAAMALKAIAKDYRVPMIVPHQVSRIGRDGEEFAADAARDSGVVEETADFLLTMWNPDNMLGREQHEKTGQVHLRIAKSRHGGRGQLLRMQIAPISLAMVPELAISGLSSTLPLGARARKEVTWLQTYRSTWPEAVFRHRTGVEGDLDFTDGQEP